MKYSLFIDNFRGFSNTFVPITDVNFLVGENSTGKTSVLGLMKLLSGSQFFLSTSHGFAVAPLNYRNFSDMVSAHSPDQNYFRIGAMWQSPPTADTAPQVAAHLLTFSNEDGVPRLSRYTFCSEKDKVSIGYKNRTEIYYNLETSDRPLTFDGLRDVFSTWVTEHIAEIPNRYDKLTLPPELPKAIPPLLLTLTMAWETAKGDTKKTTDFPLQAAGIFKPELTWIAPIRTKPKRTYDEATLDFSPEGEHTPYIIRRMLKSKSSAEQFKTFIKRVGRESGLFQDVRIKDYGPTRFELDIVLDGKPLDISNVGYGVSQSLPVLAEIIARGHGAWFAIQQPEVHLHPRAQAALGDIFFEMAAEDHKMFLIETHSDFTIDRFRMNYKKQKKKQPSSQILFFQRRDKHNVVTSIPISKTGELPKSQPDSYRDFFIREELRLLQL